MKNSNPAVIVKNVSKAFLLPQEKRNSFKSMIVNVFRRRSYEKQQVLKNINLQVEEGEFFGIVGRNGSGKSTLLKLLAGIYSPDEGDVHVNGKLTPFIELGVGFNPELTGRENVFLNGALLGFSRKEMMALYDDIVSFAELERFMDQKLKNYSSGMQVRLAFSIAIQVKSDILLLDEVLAVGDEAFQRKCLDVFAKYKKEKQTVILVTHDMGVVNEFCDRAAFLQDGNIELVGKPNKVANAYTEANNEQTSKELEKKQKDRVNDESLLVEVLQGKDRKKGFFKQGDTVQLNIKWPSIDGVEGIGVALMRDTGEYIFGTNKMNIKRELKSQSISYELALDVAPAAYYFSVGIFGKSAKERIAFLSDGPSIIVKSDGDATQAGVARLKFNYRLDGNE
jgi:ABC-2 type transport system ATP-binding protein